MTARIRNPHYALDRAKLLQRAMFKAAAGIVGNRREDAEV